MSLSRDYLYDLVTCKAKGPLAALLRGLLFLFSLLYGLAVVILAGFYKLRPAHVSCKVISVGNITLGGTGKTALVEYLAAKLSRKGIKVAVLTRGYKRNVKLPGMQGMGDEPQMLQKKLPQVPVVVDKDRLRAAGQAIKDYAADALILDDGMQQWRIFKDLEFITIDAGNPFGNYRLLPAGFLRQPLGALRHSEIFVLTQVNPGQDTTALTERLKQINPRALIAESRHKPEGFSKLGSPGEILSVDSFKGVSAVVFSGIGSPQAFEDTVRWLGIGVARALRFADHHDYTETDLEGIIGCAKKMCLDTIITTEKDAVKIARLKFGRSRIFSLNIKLVITKNEAEFDRRLLKLFSL
ncbi:MAG: tetraacyldisaccharide 4'-kinase [Candidatus Omnitrophica bacterium]|nr:tetraacyldisaccharide 4'-kinase [Candidatus Omnitrophota bacterium]